MQATLQSILDFIATQEGRWACIAIVAGLVFLLVLNRMLKRWHRRHSHATNLELLEDLATYAPAPPLDDSSKTLTLYGLPVRIRLIVLGPLGMEAGQVNAPDVEPILEKMVPGLKDRLHNDLPKVRLWPRQLSHSGFVAAFRRNTQLPKGEERVRRWILVVGKVLRDGRPVAVGLALQSTEENTLGPVVLTHAHQWMEVMRFTRHA